MTTLIKNGRIITASDDYLADVLIDGESVAQIGVTLDVKADKVIDAAGRLVIPGGIDPHVHLELPFGGTVSSDSFETGTRAAAVGGTTAVLDFAIQYKGKTFAETLEHWTAASDGKCAIDYGCHLAITEMEDRHLPEFSKVVESGVTTFKLFLAYPDVFMVDDRTTYRVMKAAGAAGGLTLVHAESGVVIEQRIQELIDAGKTDPVYHALSRPPMTEADGLARAVRIAQFAEAPVYIVHVSNAEAMNELKRAQERGQPAFGETCTQYLFLSHDNYLEPDFGGAKYVMTPPLRDKSNQEPLWEGLRRGTLALVATDHCPFFFEGQKELGRGDFRKIPNGAPGVEDRLAVFYDGAMKHGFSLNQFVNLTSTAAAKLMGMYPKKGTIAVGSDADIVIFDPDKEQVRSVKTQATNCDYNAFEGMKIKGTVETVLSRGKVIVEDGTYVGKAGDGKFMRRGKSILE